uniref:DUF2786 domain-containing protein n=1 Tax=Macrostomum lignano TaxID=282301 RepID=A0A1I8J8R5_9PLAT
MWQLAVEAATQIRKESLSANGGLYGELHYAIKESCEITVATANHEASRWRDRFIAAKSATTDQTITNFGSIVVDEDDDDGLNRPPAMPAVLYRNMWRITREWAMQLYTVHAKARDRCYGPIPDSDIEHGRRAVAAAQHKEEIWRRRYVGEMPTEE